MKHIAYHLIFILFTFTAQAREMLIVVSEPGNENYQAEFTRQVKIWQKVATEGNIKYQTIGLKEEANTTDAKTTDLQQLENAFKALPKEGDDLYLIWIGHGTYDGRTPYFNLTGKDISPKEIAHFLKPFKRRLIILNLFSASAPFVSKLSAENRVIIGSTRSQNQRNYSRFGEHLANSIQDPNADLDLDNSISLLEASLYASDSTSEFYKTEQRLLQEHAVIDDNGDGIATQLNSFDGYDAPINSKKAATPDGIQVRGTYLGAAKPELLTQVARDKRKALEANIRILKTQKKKINEEDYYHTLESLMRQMAELYFSQ